MTLAKPKIAILAFDRHFAIAPRIINEIKALGVKYQIDGYGESSIDGLHEFYKVRRPIRSIYRLVKIIGGVSPNARIWFEKWFYQGLSKKIQSKGYLFLISHNIDDALVSLCSGIPFFFNSEEYLPLQFDKSRLFRFTEMNYRDRTLRRILSNALLVIVEGESVASKYSAAFNLPLDKFYVFCNMTAYRPHLTQRNITPKFIKLVHHGLLAPERGLEILFNIMESLGPQFHLTLLGPISPEHYIKKLNEKAAKVKNITILSPVPYEKIVEALVGHDLGLVVFGSPHFHHKYMTVPNKFWECLQARVPVLVSSESAMAAYVLESGCGIVAEKATLDGYVKAIQSLTPEKISAMKARCEEKAWIQSIDSRLGDFASSIENSIDRVYNAKMIPK